MKIREKSNEMRNRTSDLQKTKGTTNELRKMTGRESERESAKD
jgi:hypothetical protein